MYLSSVGGTGNGRYCISFPFTVIAGVRVRTSRTSVEIGRSGRELRIASMSHRRVESSSYVKTLFPMTLRRCDFASFTLDSQSPPKWGALGGIIVLVMPISSAALGIDCFPNFLVRFIWSCISSFLVPTTFSLCTSLLEHLPSSTSQGSSTRLGGQTRC